MIIENQIFDKLRLIKEQDVVMEKVIITTENMKQMKK